LLQKEQTIQVPANRQNSAKFKNVTRGSDARDLQTGAKCRVSVIWKIISIEQ